MTENFNINSLFWKHYAEDLCFLLSSSQQPCKVGMVVISTLQTRTQAQRSCEVVSAAK